ncbi:MAG: hypothetical protein HY910_07130 [Desulfarculus sp.]|nr:hypothetical protein [Desulfarculus sp.]
MWETLSVVVIVGAAALWLARRVWRTVSGQAPACGCEGGDGGQAAGGRACGGCPSAPAGTPPQTGCPACGAGK